MAGIGVEAAAQAELEEASTQEFTEAWTKETGGLLAQLQSFSNQLNTCYQNIIQTDGIMSQAEARRQQMKSMLEKNYMERTKKDTAEDLAKEIKKYVYASSKGGADILIKDGLEKAEIYSMLWQARSDTYNIGYGKESQEMLTKTALSGMKLVYQLRAMITNEPEEKMVVTFAEGGFRKESQNVKALTIPMSKFLDSAIHATNELIEFNQEAFSKQLYGDPYKLKLRSNRTVLDQLKQIEGSQVTDLIIKNGNGQEQSVTRQLYEQLITNRNFLLRSDSNYDVIRKGQSGAVAESLVDAAFNNRDFQYQKDSAVWYQEPDVTANGQGYSVKNFIGGNPTLLRINSLHTVIDGLIAQLSRTDLSTSEIIQNIRTEVFKVTEGLDAATEQFLEKLISTGIGFG